MPLNKTYITHPQRIYHNPLSPATSDYDEVIPVTTSDAVIVEGTTINLTDYMKEYLASGTDQRNSTIVGEDIVKQTSSGVQAGNVIVTIAQGFSSSTGKTEDTIIKKDGYTTLSNPSADQNFLIIKLDGNFEFVKYFYGGRNFPQNPNNGDIYFNDQLRQSYKYAAGSPGTWEPYPCTAIARFNSGNLSEILPFNTWWWDELLYDSVETDIPVGMELGTIYDGSNLLKVGMGSIVDKGVFYRLDFPILKDITQSFVSGTGNGSADGSYSLTLSNLIPTDASSSNNYGFSIIDYNDNPNQSDNMWACFNPNLNTTYPRWQSVSTPAAGTITLPENESVCIRKYSITSYADSGISGRICNEWKLYGSKDGNNWDLIHYVANAGFTANNQTKTWITNSGTEYHYFKFVMLNNISGNNNYTSMGQIRLYYGTPRINVFAITDGVTTDILTSKYENPQLPSGYNSFKQIGSVILTAEDVPQLTDIYSQKGLSKEYVQGFPTITSKIDSCLDTDLNHISRVGMNNLTNYVMPQYGRVNYKTLSSSVIYQADVPGYVWVSGQNNNATSQMGVFGSFDSSDISSTSTPLNKCLWAIKDTSGNNTLAGAAVIPIPKGMYYKFYAGSGTTGIAVFIPTVGYQYNN